MADWDGNAGFHRSCRRLGRKLLNGAAAGVLGAVGSLPVAATLSATAAFASSSKTPSWSITPSESYSAPVSYLSSISCVSAKMCIAVGTKDVTGTDTTLAENWDGTSWNVMSTPNPAVATSSQLLGVSCALATACVAVGNYTTTSGDELPLGESLSGSLWTLKRPPPPTGADVATLNAVACKTASSCIAVGTYSADAPNQALAETVSGASWSIDKVPNNTGALGSELLGVSCLSSTSCTAVGDYIDSSNFDGNLAEALSGTTWSLQKSPSPAGVNESNLLSVSCTSSEACSAVGEYSTGHEVAMAERWNGEKWQLQDAAPGGGTASDLAGVFCVSSIVCRAVGVVGDHSLAEQWNGTRWSTETTTNPGTDSNNLVSISCPSSSTTFCGAVGLSADSGSDQVPLAESWNGASWRSQVTPLIYGGGDNELRAVSCSSSTSCTAVGTLRDTDGIFVTMAEQWNGTSWVVEYTPVPAGAIGSALLGVTCTSAVACNAVGYFDNAGSHALTLAERWNGTSWTIVTTPNPSHTDNATLNALSCTSQTACTAVGSYNTTTGPTVTLAESLSGTTWSISSTPNHSTATQSELNGVSCTSSTVCTAVGDDIEGGIDFTLGESLSAGKWSLEKSPNPTGAEDSELNSVSCATTTSCIAVGSYGSNAGVSLTLAEQWNGSAWKLTSTPVLKGSLETALASVSCTSLTDCVAVGGYDASSVLTLTLAEAWNGSSWSLQTTPNPASAYDSSLLAVSCTAATSCSAAGVTSSQGSADETLMEHYGS
jgi:hypothetical protein